MWKFLISDRNAPLSQVQEGKPCGRRGNASETKRVPPPRLPDHALVPPEEPQLQSLW